MVSEFRGCRGRVCESVLVVCGESPSKLVSPLIPECLAKCALCQMAWAQVQGNTRRGSKKSAAL